MKEKGKKVCKTLKYRKHTCECGLEVNRDYNSAINIIKRALPQGLRKVTPVEILNRESLKQEALVKSISHT